MSRASEVLINEVRVLYQSLVQMGDAIHEGDGISMGMRAVMEYLSREGDSTVPNMARARSVTRQRIQSLVNQLMELGYVTNRENPASQRSPLITLTTDGTRKIRQMREKEGRHLQFELTDRQLQQATKTLRAMRLSLQDKGY